MKSWRSDKLKLGQLARAITVSFRFVSFHVKVKITSPSLPPAANRVDFVMSLEDWKILGLARNGGVYER